MITDTISDLHQRGFTSDFIVLGNRLFCAQKQCFFNDNDFDILEVHSFDGDYSQKGEIVVLAIECFENEVKGILCQNQLPFYQQDVVFEKLGKFWK